MRKLLLFFLILSKVGFGQETKYISEDFTFEKGDTVYMFGNDVKLRGQPNTKSDVLTLLKIGESLEIISETNVTMLYDGIESPWYKVKSKDKVGYILGGLIARDKATISDLTYLVSLKKNETQLFAKTRVVANGLEYKEIISKLNTNVFSIKALDDKGLKNVKSIFHIKYLAEACGVDGGGIYLFYDGYNLVEAIDYTQVADADAYWFVEEYIFPSDDEGIKGKIVYQSEFGETKDYESDWVERKFTRRLLEWNGKDIIPKIQVEKN